MYQIENYAHVLCWLVGSLVVLSVCILLSLLKFCRHFPVLGLFCMVPVYFDHYAPDWFLSRWLPLWSIGVCCSVVLARWCFAKLVSRSRFQSHFTISKAFLLLWCYF